MESSQGTAKGAEMIASNRTARHTLRQRSQATRAAAKIRREGVATLATHCIAAGLPTREARSVASSLRKNAAKVGITGTAGVSYTKGRARTCTRYTSRQVGLIALVYRPRRADYKRCAARLALATMSTRALRDEREACLLLTTDGYAGSESVKEFHADLADRISDELDRRNNA